MHATSIPRLNSAARLRTAVLRACDRSPFRPGLAGGVQFNSIIPPWRRVMSYRTRGRVSFLNFNHRCPVRRRGRWGRDGARGWWLLSRFFLIARSRSCPFFFLRLLPSILRFTRFLAAAPGSIKSPRDTKCRVHSPAGISIADERETSSEIIESPSYTVWRRRKKHVLHHPALLGL